MNLNRSIALQSATVSRINDAIGSAVCFKSTSTELREKIESILSTDCKHAPRWLTSYLRGYTDAAREQMRRQHIVFGKWHDGTFYCTYRDHADYAENQPGWVDWKTYGEWSREPGMYWRADPAREYFG